MNARCLSAVLLLLLLAGFANLPLKAADGAAELRVLFVIDTSFSMGRYKAALSEIVSDFVRSGAGGRLSEGDSFALWTFHQQVAERIDRATWTSSTADALARRAADLIRSQRYEKQNRLDHVIQAIGSIAARSQTLWVFLLSDGDSSISGTPFDREINGLYQEHRREVKRLKRPFVTLLTAEAGAFIQWSVGIANPDVDVTVPSAEPNPPPEIAASPAATPAAPDPAEPDAPSNPATGSSAAEVPPSESSPPQLSATAQPQPSIVPPIVVAATPAVVPEPVVAFNPPADPDPQDHRNPPIDQPIAAPPQPVTTPSAPPPVINSGPQPIGTGAPQTPGPSAPNSPTSLAATHVSNPGRSLGIYMAGALIMLSVAITLAAWGIRSSRPKEPSLITRSTTTKRN